MRAAAYVAKQSDPLGEPELQFWFFDPQDDDIDYQDSGRAWFKSGHTGAGSCSPYFTGETDYEVAAQARQWFGGLSTKELTRLRFI